MLTGKRKGKCDDAVRNRRRSKGQSLRKKPVGVCQSNPEPSQSHPHPFLFAFGQAFVLFRRSQDQKKGRKSSDDWIDSHSDGSSSRKKKILLSILLLHNQHTHTRIRLRRAEMESSSIMIRGRVSIEYHSALCLGLTNHYQSIHSYRRASGYRGVDHGSCEWVSRIATGLSHDKDDNVPPNSLPSWIATLASRACPTITTRQSHP